MGQPKLSMSSCAKTSVCPGLMYHSRAPARFSNARTDFFFFARAFSLLQESAQSDGSLSIDTAIAVARSLRHLKLED